ncbi:sugar ABC transporter ATP-binding protein [Cohaesibacter celericrescens]|uniref:sugar ABC transporter ATP-binding protein n=1 Tax=Cohaesibacter celericrescens TaxID=2067669 RepID=UPI001FDF3F67|nr:sugar ABC transporter ATP-binding protein [Cohaesibacter celericrescens]
MTQARLTFDSVSKTFGSINALRSVSFEVAAGEAHGLVGENGAGKSTLLKSLCGVYLPSAGRIFINDKELQNNGPMTAQRAGVAMIHQELQHVPEMTVAQNLFLGRSLTRFGGLIVDRKRQEAIAAEVLVDLDPGIDPAARIGDLRVAQRQLVEIARALIDEAQIVAMDEPTSSLTPSEVDKLEVIIQRLRSKNVSVIYVSHRMDEIFRFCQTATIMRDGEVVDTVSLSNVTRDDVVARMVGRKLLHTVHTSHVTKEVLLEVKGLASEPEVKPCSFKLHRGEVLGIAGLVGAGRTELMRLIAGVDAPSAGQVIALGKPIPGGNVRAAINAGVGLVPEERKRDGIIPMRSIASNVTLPTLDNFSKFGVIQSSAIARDVDAQMRDLDLRPLDIERPIGDFSGGNQQKAIIGRWLISGVEVMLFDEPTRGVDVGAKAEIYALIEKLASQGKAIVVVSSEMPELLRLADRVLVMREGEISANLARDKMSEETIAQAAIPGTQSAVRKEEVA